MTKGWPIITTCLANIISSTAEENIPVERWDHGSRHVYRGVRVLGGPKPLPFSLFYPNCPLRRATTLASTPLFFIVFCFIDIWCVRLLVEYLGYISLQCCHVLKHRKMWITKKKKEKLSCFPFYIFRTCPSKFLSATVHGRNGGGAVISIVSLDGKKEKNKIKKSLGMYTNS